jgi:hypothetical protein
MRKPDTDNAAVQPTVLVAEMVNASRSSVVQAQP